MSQSEKHTFEEEWQRAFESAAETPPPAAWEGIEARLEARKSAVVVPLAWWRSPKVLYAAAAVAALLLLSWPALRLSQRNGLGEAVLKNTQQTPEAVMDSAPELASHTTEITPPAARIESAPGTALPVRSTPAAPEKPEKQAVADASSNNAPTLPAASPAEVSERSESIAVENPTSRSTSSAASALAFVPRVLVPEYTTPEKAISSKQARDLMQKIGGSQSAAGNGFMPKSGSSAAQSPTIIAITSSNRHGKPEDIERVIMGSSTVPVRTRALTFPIAQLSPVGTSMGAVHMATRDIRYDAAELPALPRRGRVRELWAGLSIMPALFNPKIDVIAAPAAFSNAKASRESQSSGSRGRLSYAYQAQGGKRLSRHWSVEAGVGYLLGNSDFNSPGYVLDATNSQSQNVLENALANASWQKGNYSGTQGITSSFDQSNGTYIALDQNTANDYRFVQIPLQAGYTLNPDGRLSYTLLGGVVANLFLQNQTHDSQGAMLKTTADDGVYRGLSWSATTGVRANYRLAEHWDVTLTGTYQKALASILHDSRTLDSRPQLYGVALGVRYVF